MSKCKPAKKRQQRFNKSIILFVVLVSILVAVAGSTLAILITKTNPIKNTFNYSNVACEVMEEAFTNGISIEKSNVRVKNTGDTESYIRAAIIVTWKDSAGNVYAVEPQKNKDYTISINDSDWLEKDGFYYYTKPISPKEETKILIENCSINGSGLEGYGLSVEILASAIQSKPTEAVENCWSVKVNPNGTISK